METIRPASADRTARHQIQATGQPVSGTQASYAMRSRLPHYEAKCVQRRCFQCGSVASSSDIKATAMIPFERQLIGYNFAIESFYSAPLCKRCTSYRNSVCPSIRLSVIRRYCVKTTAHSTVQFALSDSKMCLVL